MSRCSAPGSLFLAFGGQARLLTLISNCFTNINLSDMETCYKVFRREVIQSIPIEEDRFGFAPEITVKVARRNLRIYEVGISYSGRTYEEGKKIGWKDGPRLEVPVQVFAERNKRHECCGQSNASSRSIHHSGVICSAKDSL